MVAHCPRYHTIAARIAATTAPSPLPAPSHRRLALLVTALVAAQSAILAQIAADLFALRLTGATTPESISRRLRGTLSDPLLIAEECYEPALRRVIAWSPASARHPLMLAIDERSKEDVLHLFRISLPYWKTALPLVWTIWEQNVSLPPGAYWRTVDTVLDRLAALLPAGRSICIVADRAYAVAP